MTATASAIAPTCPKCQGAMWDQKNGKFPWKPGTPIFKCRDKECATNGGVTWEPKNGAPPVAKAPVVYAASKPQSEIPPLLRNQEAEDKAELDAKLAGVDTSKLEKDLALYLAISEWVVKKVGPIYADGIGWSPESATAAVATIFIQAKRNQ